MRSVVPQLHERELFSREPDAMGLEGDRCGDDRPDSVVVMAAAGVPERLEMSFASPGPATIASDRDSGREGVVVRLRDAIGGFHESGHRFGLGVRVVRSACALG